MPILDRHDINAVKKYQKAKSNFFKNFKGGVSLFKIQIA